MKRTGALLLLAMLALAACTPHPSPEQLRAADLASCDAAGFAPGSDAHGLCLVLQETNRRLDLLERRLGFMELEVSRASAFGWCRSSRCW